MKRRSLLCLMPAALLLASSPAGATILNVGHRGYSTAFPENTLVALNGAFQAGADLVEIDLQKSADGHVVVIHDDTVNRTTDGVGRVDEKTLAELRTLDAGSWFAPEFTGEPIPTLEEALLEALGVGPLLLDQKSSLLFGAEIADALAVTGFPIADVWVTAWNEAQVADIVAQVPGATILWTAQVGPAQDPDAIQDFLDHMATIGVDGFSFVSEYYTLIAPGFLADAQDAGFGGFAWDIFAQSVAKMETAIQIGLDGYIVNDVATFGTVIPEPGTGLLLAGGLAGLAARRLTSTPDRASPP